MPTKLLLIEDTDSDREVMVGAIQRCGLVEVVIKTDGHQALQYLRALDTAAFQAAPAVIFLDLALPRASGFEILRDLHEHANLREIPVVVFTRSQRDADIYISYRLGANAYVVKPVETEELARSVELAAAFWLRLNVRPEH